MEKSNAKRASTPNSNAPPPVRVHEAEEIPEGAKPPNTLRISVLRARNLPIASLRATMSAYCKLKCAGLEYKTKVKSKTVDPVWNEVRSARKY